jgi:hypothetical protein
VVDWEEYVGFLTQPRVSSKTYTTFGFSPAIIQIFFGRFAI